MGTTETLFRAEHSGKTMTETTDKPNEETKELSISNYKTLLDGFQQSNAEGWFDVARTDGGQLQARPVARQSDRTEGSEITSDQWLIKEPTGDVYTVSDATFEDAFDSNVRFEQFVVDFSTDDEVLSDTDEEITVDGWNVVATVTAKIDIVTQSVVSIHIDSVDFNQDQHRGLDGLPIEVLEDSPQFNKITDDDT